MLLGGMSRPESAAYAAEVLAVGEVELHALAVGAVAS